LLAVVSVLCVVGCKQENQQASVIGTAIRKDGSPLVGAKIIARCESVGKTVYGTTDQNGVFRLGSSATNWEIPPGPYTVRILEDRGDMDHRAAPTISARFASAERSDLKFEVGKGEEMTIQFKLDPP
jgi:hypothetical protein